MFTSFGDSGDRVVALQLSLVHLGYDISYMSSSGVKHPGTDGQFGAATLRGLEEFQSDWKIVEKDRNGRAWFGPKCWTVMFWEPREAPKETTDKFVTSQWVNERVRQHVRNWHDVPSPTDTMNPL